MNFRIGHGYDVHRLVEGRDLILGGVNIPWKLGLLGHSDADVLAHAIMDAILGAAAGKWSTLMQLCWHRHPSCHLISTKCVKIWQRLQVWM